MSTAKDYDLEVVVDGVVVRTADEWAGVIKADLKRAVEGIVAAGRNLVSAKADVQHGEWLPMLKTIGISEAEASRLRLIASKVGNLPTLEGLPSSVSALYELSKLESEQIEDGLATGAITSEMTIQGAKQFAQPEPTEADCIHCGNTFPLSQLYEGGQGYECDPCVSPDHVEDEVADAIGVLPDDYRALKLVNRVANDGMVDEAIRDLAVDQMSKLDSGATSPSAAADFIERALQGEPILPPDPYEQFAESPDQTSDPKGKSRKTPDPPITKSFWSANYKLTQAVRAVVRLSENDRFKKNKDQISGSHLSDLVRARDAINGVIQQLEG